MKAHTFTSSDEDTHLYVIRWRHTPLCHQMKAHTFMSSDEDTHHYVIRWRHTPLRHQMKAHTFMSSDEDTHLYVIRWRHTPLCHQMKTHLYVIRWRHTFTSSDEGTHLYVIRWRYTFMSSDEDTPLCHQMNTHAFGFCISYLTFVLLSQFSAAIRLGNVVIRITAAVQETWCKARSLALVCRERKDAFWCSSLDVLTGRKCAFSEPSPKPQTPQLMHFYSTLHRNDCVGCGLVCSCTRGGCGVLRFITNLDSKNKDGCM